MQTQVELLQKHTVGWMATSHRGAHLQQLHRRSAAGHDVTIDEYQARAVRILWELRHSSVIVSPAQIYGNGDEFLGYQVEP